LVGNVSEEDFRLSPGSGCLRLDDLRLGDLRLDELTTIVTG
jgi:hypothetical protein